MFNFIFFLLGSIAYLNHSIANESEKIIKFYVKFGSSKDTLFLGALVHSPLAQAAADSDYDMTNFSAYQVFHFFCLIVFFNSPFFCFILHVGFARKAPFSVWIGMCKQFGSRS